MKFKKLEEYILRMKLAFSEFLEPLKTELKLVLDVSKIILDDITFVLIQENLSGTSVLPARILVHSVSTQTQTTPTTELLEKFLNISFVDSIGKFVFIFY